MCDRYFILVILEAPLKSTPHRVLLFYLSPVDVRLAESKNVHFMFLYETANIIHFLMLTGVANTVGVEENYPTAVGRF